MLPCRFDTIKTRIIPHFIAVLRDRGLTSRADLRLDGETTPMIRVSVENALCSTAGKLATTARGPRSGFTLVELLVVIAIIALLAAFAIPALNRSLGSAAIAQSVSNLRTIASMTHGYAADNNGTLPPLANAGDEEPGWDNLLLAYSTGTPERIFAARSDRFPRPDGKTPRSYSLNPRFAGMPLVLISQHSRVALLIERHASLNGDPMAYVGGPPVKPTGYSDFPYQGKTQLAFADGSVAMVEQLGWVAWHHRYIDPENPDWQ